MDLFSEIDIVKFIVCLVHVALARRFRQQRCRDTIHELCRGSRPKGRLANRVCRLRAGIIGFQHGLVSLTHSQDRL